MTDERKDELELEIRNAAHTITVWAYSGSESRRRAVAELLADVMVAVEHDRMADARDQMRRLLVMASWTEMSLDEVAEALGLDATDRQAMLDEITAGLVRQGHDPEQALALAEELVQNTLWSIDVEPAPE